MHHIGAFSKQRHDLSLVLVILRSSFGIGLDVLRQDRVSQVDLVVRILAVCLRALLLIHIEFLRSSSTASSYLFRSLKKLHASLIQLPKLLLSLENLSKGTFFWLRENYTTTQKGFGNMVARWALSRKWEVLNKICVAWVGECVILNWLICAHKEFLHKLHKLHRNIYFLAYVRARSCVCLAYKGFRVVSNPSERIHTVFAHARTTRAPAYIIHPP